MENQEVLFYFDHHSLQDTKVFGSPIYDEYNDSDFIHDDKLNEKQASYPIFDSYGSDYEEYISTLASMYFCSSDPVYEILEFESWEGNEGNDIEQISVAVSKSEGDLTNQSLITFFSAKMNQQSPKIGEHIVEILK